MQDRRNYIRYVISGTVNLKFSGDSAPALKANLDDIGFIGFSIYWQELIALGQLVQFEINTEFMDTPLTGKGKIKNIAEVIENESLIYKIGIEFTEVEQDVVLKLINCHQAKIISEEEKGPRPKFPYGPL